MGEHRVPMLGSLRRYEDPAKSRDPRVRAVLTQLAILEMAPPARAHFRAELRAQLVAVAPRLVAEGMAAEAPPVPRVVIADRPRPLPHPRPAAVPSRPRRLLAQVAALHVARPLGVFTAVLAVFGALLAGALVVSRHALPGDALYGLKRASESVELATASGPVDKAKDLLRFAKTRASEVSELLGQAKPGSIDGHTAGLVKSTLGSADSDLRQASRLLGTAAVQRDSDAPLSVIINWAPGQLSRLQAIAARIPQGALHDRAVASAGLVQSAVTRATQLRPVLACMSGADSDALGPIPVSGCTAATVPVPVPGTTQPGTSGPGTGSLSVPSITGTNPSTQTTQGLSSGSTPPGSTSTNPLPIPIPSVSLTTPITIDSCGTSISLGPIDIGVGPCGVHAGVGSATTSVPVPGSK
jgi:hypothetical protein